MQRFSWALGRRLNGVATLDLGGPRLRIRLRDGYWTKLLVGQPYEPGLGELLAREVGPNAPLLDCGANIGYWSLLASTRWGAPVVAVEAATTTYEQLVGTNELNGSRFCTVHAALWSCEEERLTIVTHELRHAGSSVVTRRDKIAQAGYQEELVQTVTIDGLVARHFPEAKKIVVKLDVEGAEIAALSGATKTLLTRQVVLVYEDADGSVSEAVRQHGYTPRSLGSGNYVARQREIGVE